MKISLPTDTDGFLTQECPSCRQHFKVVFGEGSNEPVAYCPYCKFEGHDCWWTQSQEDYISAAVTDIVLGPELRKVERSFKNATGGLLKIEVKSSAPKVPPPPIDVDGVFEVFRFPCCDETIKADQREILFCVICGSQMDLRMSNSKKIFLSHKGVDKNLVIEFKDTLQVLGYEPWLDEDAMPAGTALERGILKGMQDSCGVVFFITPSFRDEGFLEAEINYAIQEKRKKGDKFAIVTLLFGDDDNPNAIPELLRPYVWKKPRTNFYALREIIRALPVRLGPVDWREGIEGVGQTSRVKSKFSELSYEAKAILLEASAGDGFIMHRTSLNSKKILANEKSLLPQNDQRTIALWVGGIEDLVRRRFIKDIGHKGEVFEVTREGYEEADKMRANNDSVMV